MAWSDYQVLQVFGQYGWSIKKRYAQVHFKKPGGYVDPSITTGHSEGDIELALQFSVLPKSALQNVTYLDDLWSRCDYLWRFFCDQKEAGNKPFIVECEWPGQLAIQQLLVRFAEDEISFTEIAARMFSAGSVPFEQVRIEGFQLGLDQVMAENPSSI